MVDLISICDQLVNNEDINVKGWREVHQIFAFCMEQAFSSLPEEFEVLITGF